MRRKLPDIRQKQKRGWKIRQILVHSEDIMMSAELTYSLVEKMLRMYQKLWEVTGTL